MDNKIHITTARHMLQSPEPVDLTVLTTKGEKREYKKVIGLKPQHRAGSRNIKFPDSGEIRKIRDCLILAVNGLEVFY
ncbi:MAG: hypothetical protein NC039_09130 [Muribaculaceae bacterium]|nr:hypothetical protein [Muribaculaceae bacterium]